jgi:hypothetical protein
MWHGCQQYANPWVQVASLIKLAVQLSFGLEPADTVHAAANHQKASTVRTSLAALTFSSSAICAVSGLAGAGSPSAAGLGSCALSALMSSTRVRERLYCQPSQPAYKEATNRPPITAGWMSAAVRPSRIPNSPPAGSTTER